MLQQYGCIRLGRWLQINHSHERRHCLEHMLPILLQENKAMKKILVVFDGVHFPSSTLDFALEMNSREPITLTGIFLPSVDYADVMNYAWYGNTLTSLYLKEYENDAEAIKKNIAEFETFCKDHHIRYKVHKDMQQSVVKELHKETRYADLLVLSSAHFYENLGEMIQEEYLKDTLHKAECPVLLLPGSYTRPDNIIFAYDGSSTSMHAMRQFIYLFPHWTELNTLVTYIDEGSNDIPDLSLIKEYTAQYFSKLAYYKLDTGPKAYFNTWVKDKGASILVSGSYGRSAFSELFRKNFLKDMKEQEMPLFIAHL